MNIKLNDFLAYLRVDCFCLYTSLLFICRNTVSTWSSGTGGSGVGGALSYAAMTAAGLSPRHTLLVMLVVPVLMAIRSVFNVVQNN